MWAFVVALGPDQVTGVAQRTLAGEGNMLLDTTGDMLGTVGRDIVNVLLLIVGAVLLVLRLLTVGRLSSTAELVLPAASDAVAVTLV